MVAYNRISQAENQSVSKYLTCTKDYLECINHTSRVANMDVSGLNHISLVQGLSDHYVRRRVSKDAENWKTMADAFNSITKIARTAGKTTAYSEPRYEKPTDINAINYNYNNIQRCSFKRYQGTYKNNQGGNYNSRNNSQNNVPRWNSNKEPVRYLCAGPHYITNCSQYQKDKDRYKCTTWQVKQSFQNKLKQGAKKNSININQAYFENKEDANLGNYSEEQAEEVCKLLDNDSESLNIREIHVNEVGNDTNSILYKVQVYDQPVTALFDTGASM